MPIFMSYYHPTYFLKDHLVMWIVKYIENYNSDTQAKQILDNIDHWWVTLYM